ncbi:MAG: hypothetical protein ACYTGN_09660 [Planctomycetota bacterium]|jgi:hypothetical protein
MRVIGALFFCATIAQAQQLKAGPLTLDFHITKTAQLFHVVDQLSNWSPYTHAQYRRWYGELSVADKEQLERHAAIRKKYGWQGGLQLVGYTHVPYRTALKNGAEAGQITADEAKTEAEVLKHFEKRVAPLLEQERARLDAFRKRAFAQRKELTAFATRVARFCHGHQARVPVYLIANPSDNSIGGGYNGGFLTLEVARQSDTYPTFLHELMHAFVNKEKGRLVAASSRTPGLDYTTLNEGIAYALSPGLFAAKGHELAGQVENDRKRGLGIDQAYPRFRRYGLELQPLLERTLEKGTLETFLPQALDAWAKLAAEELKPRENTYFSAGPGYRTVGQRLGKVAYWSYSHVAKHYATMLEKVRPGEPVLLLFALDRGATGAPKGYEDLLPRPWHEIEAELKAGRSVETTGTGRNQRIILLAAPTLAELETLILETELLRR